MFSIPHHQEVVPSISSGNSTIYNKDLPPRRAYVEVLIGVNPSSPNSAQDQFSPYNYP